MTKYADPNSDDPDPNLPYPPGHCRKCGLKLDEETRLCEICGTTDYQTIVGYEVTCAICGKTGMSYHFMREGDKWECQECW